MLFANNTIYFLFSFFLIFELCFLILAFIVKDFIPIAELEMRIRIPIKEAKAETESNAITTEAKISYCSK